MEGAFLEGKQVGLGRVAPGSLGEHIDTLLVKLDLGRGTGHGLSGVAGVLAVDEDSAREAHEPSEKWYIHQGALGRDGAVLGEDGTEHQGVELGLVVANDDGRPDRVEVAVGVLDGKENASKEQHDPFQGTAGNILCASSMAD